MATSYLAPGVYVEETPAAQRPIVAVGTNTVGFIGLVDDKIKYPVINPTYDPVAARQAIGAGADAAAALKKQIEQKRVELEQAPLRSSAGAGCGAAAVCGR